MMRIREWNVLKTKRWTVHAQHNTILSVVAMEKRMEILVKPNVAEFLTLLRGPVNKKIHLQHVVKGEFIKV